MIFLNRAFGLLITIGIVSATSLCNDGEINFSTHGILIFLDDSEQYLDAVSRDLYVALEEQAAPILTSNSLLAAIFLKTPNLQQMALDKKDVPFKEYADYYDAVRKSLEELIGAQKNIDTAEQKAIIEKLRHHIFEELHYTVPKLNLEGTSPALDALLFQNSSFNPEEWIIKTVSKGLMLLIPKKYKNSLNKFDFSQYRPSTHKLTGADKPTPAEFATGLKIDHMETVQPKDFNKAIAVRPARFTKSFTADYFVKALWNNNNNMSDIFVSRTEYRTAKNAAQPRWVILMNGHGDTEVSVDLYTHDFVHTLDIFQTKINTSLLAYITCYALGTAADLIYKDTAKQTAKTYSFIILTQGVTNQMMTTWADIASLDLTTDSIDFDKKRFKFVSSIQFNQFINLTTTTDTIDIGQVSETIMPFAGESLNITQVRLPGSEWFKTVDLKNKPILSVSFGNILAKTCKKIELPKFFTRNKIEPSFYFLDAPIIPCELVFSFTPDKLPVLIPTASPKAPSSEYLEGPEEFTYFIEKITAPSLTLAQVLHVLSHGISNGYRFVLWVRTLEVQRGGGTILPQAKGVLQISNLIIDRLDDEEGTLHVYFTYNNKFYEIFAAQHLDIPKWPKVVEADEDYMPEFEEKYSKDIEAREKFKAEEVAGTKMLEEILAKRVKKPSTQLEQKKALA